jgi:hypothetical protein
MGADECRFADSQAASPSSPPHFITISSKRLSFYFCPTSIKVKISDAVVKQCLATTELCCVFLPFPFLLFVMEVVRLCKKEKPVNLTLSDQFHLLRAQCHK